MCLTEITNIIANADKGMIRRMIRRFQLEQKKIL